MPKRRIRGDRAFKRLLKQLPETVKQQVVDELDLMGKQQLSSARGLVPVGRTGRLKAGLSYKVLKATLKLRVGILGKPLNKKLFYGRIVEFGRKAQVVDVVRGGLSSRVRAAGGRSNRYKALANRLGVTGAYKLRVKARSPRHFIYTSSRDTLAAPFKRLWQRALEKAAYGVSDD